MADSNERHDLPFPNMEKLLELGGSRDIINTTNFIAAKIKNVYEKINQFQSINMSTGCRKNLEVSLLDSFCIVLTLTENNRTWAFFR